MVGNGCEMVGVYPTYVLRSGAFLAGAFFFVKSRPLFLKSAFLYVGGQPGRGCLPGQPNPPREIGDQCEAKPWWQQSGRELGVGVKTNGGSGTQPT